MHLLLRRCNESRIVQSVLPPSKAGAVRPFFHAPTAFTPSAFWHSNLLAQTAVPCAVKSTHGMRLRRSHSLQSRRQVRKRNSGPRRSHSGQRNPEECLSNEGVTNNSLHELQLISQCEAAGRLNRGCVVRHERTMYVPSSDGRSR
jgi:hypothetical protein